MNEEKCLECKRSFLDVKRFEATNLCVSCFTKSREAREKPDRDRKAVLIYKAADIAEKQFIKVLMDQESIPLYYVPGASRGMFGVEESLNIAVDAKHAQRARDVLKQQGIKISMEYGENAYEAARRYSPYQDNPYGRIYLFFVVILFLALILFFILAR